MRNFDMWVAFYHGVNKFQGFLVDYHCPLFRVMLNTPPPRWEVVDGWEDQV